MLTKTLSVARWMSGFLYEVHIRQTQKSTNSLGSPLNVEETYIKAPDNKERQTMWLDTGIRSICTHTSSHVTNKTWFLSFLIKCQPHMAISRRFPWINIVIKIILCLPQIVRKEHKVLLLKIGSFTLGKTWKYILYEMFFKSSY